MVIGLSGVQFGLTDDRAAGVRFVYQEYDYRPNWTTQSLLPINRKSYNFREKKNSPVMKERGI